MDAPELLLREVRRFSKELSVTEASERELMEQFLQTRSEAAFAEIVRRHGPMVFGVCRRVLRHTADAEDASQAVFLVLLRKAPGLNDYSRLGPWLHGVAWRVASKLRSQRHHATVPDDFPDRCVNNDWANEIDSALAQIPEKYRTPMILCYLQGLSISAASAQFRCSSATLATWLHRGREQLRVRLIKRGMTLPVAFIVLNNTLPSALGNRITALLSADAVPSTITKLAYAYMGRITMRTILLTSAFGIALSIATIGIFAYRADGQEPTKPMLPPPVVQEQPPKQPSQPTEVSTPNFHVTAPSARIAKLIAEAAERTRKEDAIRWFGKELPNWDKPVAIHVKIQKSGSGGATTFSFPEKFNSGTGFEDPPASASFSAKMDLQGELDVILTDTLNHEVMHCLLASHFKKPIVRWADEGIALLSESEDSQRRHYDVARDALKKPTPLPIETLLSTKEYPSDIASFYAQSYVLAEMLVKRKDRATLLQFIADGLKDNWIEAWERAATKHYGFANLKEMQTALTKATASAAPDITRQAPLPSNGVPSFGLASINEKGQITVYLATVYYTPVTSYRTEEEIVTVDGKQEKRSKVVPVTSYKARSAYVPHVFEKGEAVAVDVKSHPIPEKDLQRALKSPTAVVISPDKELVEARKLNAGLVQVAPGGLDSEYVKLLQPNTIIILLPKPFPQADAPHFAKPGGR